MRCLLPPLHPQTQQRLRAATSAVYESPPSAAVLQRACQWRGEKHRARCAANHCCIGIYVARNAIRVEEGHSRFIPFPRRVGPPGTLALLFHSFPSPRVRGKETTTLNGSLQCPLVKVLWARCPITRPLLWRMR